MKCSQLTSSGGSAAAAALACFTSCSSIFGSRSATDDESGSSRCPRLEARHAHAAATAAATAFATAASEQTRTSKLMAVAAEVRRRR